MTTELHPILVADAAVGIEIRTLIIAVDGMAESGTERCDDGVIGGGGIAK